MSGQISLTPEQQAAVDADEGCFLLQAAPGAGKTEVVVQRISRLLRTSPRKSFRILAITHTNRAAEAVTRRIAADVADESWRLASETVHGFCRGVLSSYGQPVGVTTGFGILARRDERREALEEALTGEGIAASGMDVTAADEMLRGIDALRTVEASPDLGVQLAAGVPLTKVLDAYERLLDRWGVQDFPGLLWRTVALLRTDDWTRRHLARVNRHVIVDEAQDCTPTQFEVVSLAAGEDPNLFVVADEPQSIYGFGGADPARILGAYRDQYQPTVLRLHSNFRSAGAIVALANHLSAHMPGDQPVPPMVAAGTATGRVRAWSCADEDAEAEQVVAWVTALLDHGLDAETLEPNESPSLHPSDIAVLARTRFGLAPLQARLEALGIDHLVRTPGDDDTASGPATLVLAALQAQVTPNNPLPARLLTQGVAGEGAAGYGVPALTVPVAQVATIRGLADEFASDAIDLPELLRRLEDVELADPPEQELWEREREELRRCWRTYAARTVESARSVGGFLGQLSRLRAASLDQPGVRLLSMHGAKGAEFKAVCVLGLNDGTIPHYRSLDDPAKLAEERRGLYVAITRPSRELLLTRPRSRATRYGTRSQDPSRFLAEMGLGMEHRP